MGSKEAPLNGSDRPESMDSKAPDLKELSSVDPDAISDLQKELDDILVRLVGKIEFPSEEIDVIPGLDKAADIGHKILQARIDAMKAMQEKKLKDWEEELNVAQEEIQEQLPTLEQQYERAVVDVRRVIERMRLSSPDMFADLQVELNNVLGSDILKQGEDVDNLMAKLKQEAQLAIEEASLRIERIKAQRRTEEIRVEQQEKLEQAELDIKARDMDAFRRQEEENRRKREEEVKNQLLQLERSREQRRAEEDAASNLRRLIEKVRSADCDTFEGLKMELDLALKDQLSVCGSQMVTIKDEADIAVSQAMIRIDRIITQRRVEGLKREMDDLEMKMKAEAKEDETKKRAREELQLQTQREEESQKKLQEIEQAKLRRQQEDQALSSVRKALDRLRVQAIPETFDELKSHVEEVFSINRCKIIVFSAKIRDEVDAGIADAKLRVERISIQREMAQKQLEKEELRRAKEEEHKAQEAQEATRLEEEARRSRKNETQQQIQDRIVPIERRSSEEQAVRAVRSAIDSLRAAVPDNHQKMEEQLKAALQSNMPYFLESNQRLMKDEVQNVIEQTAVHIKNISARDQMEELRRAREVARQRDEWLEKLQKHEQRGEQQEEQQRRRELELQEQCAAAQLHQKHQQEADQCVVNIRKILLRMRISQPEHFQELEAELDAAIADARNRPGLQATGILDEAAKGRAECKQRVERVSAQQQAEERLREQRELTLAREADAKQRFKQEEKRKEQEARRARELETQRQLQEIEGMRVQRRREEEALTAVRSVVEESRLCTPEAYPSIKARLQATLSKQLTNAGSHSSKMKEEAERALEHAQERVDRIMAERERQEGVRRAGAEKREMEAVELAQQAREMQRIEQELQERTKVAAEEKLHRVDSDLQRHHAQDEALQFVRRTIERLRQTNPQSFKDLQAVKEELDGIVATKLNVAGPHSDSIRQESANFLEETSHRVGYFTAREKIEEARQSQDELRRQRDADAERRARDTEQRLFQELRERRDSETKRQLEEIERSRLQRMVEAHTQGVVDDLTKIVLRDGAGAALDPTKELEEALMAK
eukprot:gnl/MRDRNA2_/MRDRNA2_109767_c0_seq1.p1 gnl/MRDRNA2_/MRDRNA2_109767_c0~~gnl/MRDRNA2_/MRDRNA2_109767_c0_seq1.p1  ORF type:complete len:1066 (+),score=351.54 gnl/MRDRNA2_/MRDRNA2_109767_c0_seq1:168-3365(+)